MKKITHEITSQYMHAISTDKKDAIEAYAEYISTSDIDKQKKFFKFFLKYFLKYCSKIEKVELHDVLENMLKKLHWVYCKKIK